MTKQKDKRRRRARTRQKRSSIWPYLLLGGVALVAVVAVVWFVAFRPGASQPAAPVPTVPRSDTGGGTGEIPNPEVPRVSLADAKTRYDAGAALFVDTRTQEAYAVAHISNAISLPSTDVEARYRELPQEAEIITY